MTPEQNALVADLREDAIAQHITNTPESKLTAWRLETSADLIEAQAAELATLKGGA